MIPTLPLRARNRLAETILTALHDPAARHALQALSAEDTARGWLAADEARWAPALAERARAACAALHDEPLRPHGADLAQALAAAAVLFDAALYFEVHEVLEPHWLVARDEAREALQGLIQIAVAWQHLANGNVAGARSLLSEGAARLHGRRLVGLDFDVFARAALDAGARLPAARPPAFPRLPR